MTSPVPEGWVASTIGDQFTLQRGIDITRAVQVDGQVPVVSSGGVSSWHNEAAASAPGVVIGRKGTLGHVYFLEVDYWPHDTTLWVRDFKGNDPRFVYYFLRNADFSHLDVGTANPTLNRNHVHPIKTVWPPIYEQRGIAEVLGVLDELIDVNTALASECANLAGMLWREAARGLIPSVRLSERSSILLGGTPSRAHPEYWGGNIPWLNSGQANEFRVIRPSEYITGLGLENSSAKLMPVGTTIIAITGATLGHVSRIEIEACGNQSLVGVYSEDAVVNDHLFFAILEEIDTLVRSATGGAQQHVNKANIEELRVKWLPEDKMNAWHLVAAPLMKATANLLSEADQLANVRDQLLPLLMSGAVRVRAEGVAA